MEGEIAGENQRGSAATGESCGIRAGSSGLFPSSRSFPPIPQETTGWEEKKRVAGGRPVFLRSMIVILLHAVSSVRPIQTWIHS